MMLIINLLVSAIAVFVTARILPGVEVDSFSTALIVAVVLGVVNAFIRPILLVLTLPITIMTLGLFTFVIIGVCVLIVDALVPGFTVASFWWALIFALVLVLISGFLESLTPAS